MIHGKDIIIYEGDETPVAIAASKSCTIDKVAGTIETSSPASGTARSYASGRTDWVATLNNLVLSVKDYMLRVGETYYLTIGVRGSSTDTISGYAICTECNVTGTVGNLAQGSFRFHGSDREGTIPPQPGETGYDMTEDQVTAIVYNVVGDGYLSRLHNDTAQGLITFNAGAYIPAGQYLRIGDAYLTYDAEYGMLKVWDGSGVVERGLYATGSVSALGAASGGGGGGGGGGDMDRDSMFAILSGAPASASEWINAKFLKLGPGLAASNDGTLTITGAVTSVGLTMPTGFTVSGSPVTSSGVIAVSLATGYKLLTSSTATPGTYTKVTVDTYGRVTAGSTLSSSDIPVLPASKVPNIEDLDNFSTRVYDAAVNRTANTVLAGPSSGSASPATFRALVPADIPYVYDLDGYGSHVYDATVNRTANTVLAGPTSGSSNPATFRSLVPADIPTNISITGNAATATTASKLSTTSKTAWGQTYWTSGGVPTSISGDMSNVGNISATYYYLNDDASNPYLRFYRTGGSYYYIQQYQDYIMLGAGSAYSVKVDSSGSFYLKTGHLYLDGAKTSSSTGNDSQIIFRVSGTQQVEQVAISSNTNALIINPTSGTTTGQWVIGVNGNNTYTTGSGNFGIGMNNPSQKLHVSGNILATGAVTALSDMRQKSFLCNIDTDMETLAKLPIFYYKWKDGRDVYMHIGTSAQAVQRVFPELVLGEDELSVNYGVLGTTLGILNSRKLADHEQRIKDLEDENKRLRERIMLLEDKA